MGAVAYLDRTNISIAGTSIIREFHLTNVQLGLLQSAFLGGYALFQAPGGRLAERLGARWTLAAGVVWWGVFTALTATVPPGAAKALLILLSIRFILGAGEAIIYPTSNQVVANWIPSRERGLANGFIFAGVGVGAGITPPLITFIMIHEGWRWSFWISALIGLVVGAVWFAIARDTPEQHPRVSAAELALIKAGLTHDFKSSGTPVPWRTIVSSREVVAMTASYFVYGYLAWIFFAWFFIYLATVRGLNLKVSALYSMLPFLAMASGSPVGGVLSDFLTRHFGKRAGRCGIGVLGLGLAGTFVAVGSHVESARLAAVVLAGGAGALYLSQSSYWSVTADIAGPSAGSVSGVMNMGGQVGGMVTASLTPVIAAQFGWTASFVVAAALCVAGSLAWLFVDPDRPLEDTCSCSSSD